MTSVPGVVRVLFTVRTAVYLLTNQVILKLIMQIAKAVLHVWMNVQRMLFQENVR